jgi:hypothetical protein
MFGTLLPIQVIVCAHTFLLHCESSSSRNGHKIKDCNEGEEVKTIEEKRISAFFNV